MTASGSPRVLAFAFVATALLILTMPLAPALAQRAPEIRLSDRNRVPACVTPPRLMRFLTDRNPSLPPQFRTIAAYYKTHGERLGVRWDFAFYQMLLETNYLKFRNASGKGDVSPSQNNFAGIGTIGGGVPGDSFADVSTGVLAQMQHLIAYSGERVPHPVARRTREKQDHIIALSLRLGRPVTYRDLAGRWAVDRRYWRSISSIADRYHQQFCTGRQPPEPGEAVRDEVTASLGAEGARVQAGASGLGLGSGVRAPAPLAPPVTTARPRTACKVFTASYGGRKNVLIRAPVGNEVHYTALQVLDGREADLAEAFIQNHAAGGVALGEYPSRDEALTAAFNLCPAGGAEGRG